MAILIGPPSMRPTLCMLLSAEQHPGIHQETVSNQMLRLKHPVPLESDCHSVCPCPNEIEYQLPLFDNYPNPLRCSIYHPKDSM